MTDPAPSPTNGLPPPSDIDVDIGLVQALLAEQFPELAELPLRRAAEGWDCVTIRLGEGLAVRLPRRELAAKLVDHEQAWLPVLAPQLPIPIPAPVRVGRPTDDYPWSWSVVPWFAGSTALTAHPAGAEATRLGSFLSDLHSIPTPLDPPVNPHRGGQLHDRRDLYSRRLQDARGVLGDETAGAAYELFCRSLEVSANDVPVWLHGDLHSKNVITVEGRIEAVIDWGDVCTGDPATDLASLWIIFDVDHHDLFWQSYGPVADSLLARSKGWAIAFGLMLWDSHHDADPAFAAAGLTTMLRALA